ncbi:MAG: hypothetical protein KIT69_04390 [Propionibacteriaceae bacterium]|nr:hypothetical protein [Propionibacteriaceae bacterium]
MSTTLRGDPPRPVIRPVAPHRNRRLPGGRRRRSRAVRRKCASDLLLKGSTWGIAYNSQANIYFGYMLVQVEEQFEGQK